MPINKSRVVHLGDCGLYVRVRSNGSGEMHSETKCRIQDDDPAVGLMDGKKEGRRDDALPTARWYVEIILEITKFRKKHSCSIMEKYINKTGLCHQQGICNAS